MNRNERFIKNSAIYAIGIIIPRLRNFILLPLYTAYLSKTAYGYLDIYQSIIALFVPIATIEIQQAAFRFLITENQEEKKEQIISNTISFGYSAVFVCSLFTFLPIFAIDFGIRILFFWSFNVHSWVEIMMMIARGLKKYKTYSVSAIISSTVSIIGVCVCFLILHLSINSVLLTFIVADSVTVVYLILSTKVYHCIKMRNCTWKYIKKLLDYSWPVVPTAIASWIMSLSDRLVLSASISVEATATYTVANKIPQTCNLFVTLMNLAWQESASLASVEEDYEKYYSGFYSKMYRFLIGGVSVLIAFSPGIFKILVKGGYGESLPHMYILFIAFFFSCISTFYTGIYIAFYKTRIESITIAIAATINFLFDIFTVHAIGIYAASISTLISYIVLTVIRRINMNKYCCIRYDHKTEAAGLLVLIAFSAFVCNGRNIIQAVCIPLSIIVLILFNKDLLEEVLKIIKKHMRRRNER